MKAVLQAGAWAVVVVFAVNTPARAVEKEDIDRAVQRGVAALRRGQDRSGAWQGQQRVGLTALNALTLLECDVAADDPAVKQAVQFVRTEAVKETQTYSLALSILLLDHVGDPLDEDLIESLAARLIAGQSRDGGWSYSCPRPSNDDIQRLTKQATEANQRKERIAPKTLDDNTGEKKAPDKEKVTRVMLKVQELLSNQNLQNTNSDNSNVQFATLGLWVARRHGLPVEQTLDRVGQHFRASQNRDGGWPYSGMTESTATMTAAGSLCLCVVDATANDVIHNRDPKLPELNLKRDVNLVQGLNVLGTLIGQPLGNRINQPMPNARVAGKTYYFLWSLERVCVALDLTKLGNKDWFNWGAEIILAGQQNDGTWAGDFAPADTCFALLFLRRTNLARDLTSRLRGKLGDAGERTLKSGGVGGDALKGNVISSPIEVKPEPKGLDEKTERGKLAKEIVQASGAKQEKLIEKCRDEKGVAYTEALASAIPHLSGEAKNKARDALAERLARMKAETLTNYLKDEEPEIRSAAALACALKDSKAHVPQLIELLRDKDGLVARAAVTALKNLTGQNFGPAANATTVERDKAIAAWQNWWKKQQR